MIAFGPTAHSLAWQRFARSLDLGGGKQRLVLHLFFEAMVRCVGTKFSLDAKRLYLGGISAGGTVTNRALTFNSDFWAGGMPISGEWYVSNDDGSALSFNDARQGCELIFLCRGDDEPV